MAYATERSLEAPVKVAALTLGRDAPSARFRIRQYRSQLVDHGVMLKEYCPVVSQMIPLPGVLGTIRRRYLFPWPLIQSLLNIFARLPAFVGCRGADVTVINRCVLPGLDELVALLPRPRILDVDDAIWLTDPRGSEAAARLVRRVDAVIAGNEYLATWYRQHNNNVFVVPTAVDTDKYRPMAPEKHMKKTGCTIGWIGTAGNFPHLRLVWSAIKIVLTRCPEVRVLVVSDRRPEWVRFDGERAVFRAWSEETEARDLRDMDIGIMPLHDNEWTRGKCGFKMLQYLAVGIPVVVSPVGMNNDILNGAELGFGARDEKEWVTALIRLSEDRGLRQRLGANGRALVESKYSTRRIASRLAEIVFSQICR
jgi:glycosyltransferase involved in cell wall biosynthesis